MCVRLRQQGWKVRRLDAEVAWHEAGMSRFGQWWRREVRGGYAAAEGAATHGRLPERHRVHAMRRNWAWGLLFPLLVVTLVAAVGPLGLLLLLVYPTLMVHAYRSLRRRRNPPRDARLYALFCILGKFPQVIGQMRYWYGRLLARPSRLIEYKGDMESAGTLTLPAHANPTLSGSRLL